ncbi:hypothetical protein TPHA_0L02360 [Tetrapisispora phaffii CBS 4417]|uniref:Catalase n=1 Tax=Tetrapisispora phaffii (strain ATCC 24235 / CBS 4417 / NBRC 1672 / NRRL Y-8282 / UCD 70-5) TaxID=1071381 RepID=G8C0A9_TETPH|nr:hypothetical protein TPHA_0L02360 [Tetrapisispora phaffii CBS 4417]CCE65587.1 hypothetical protein TPHA_0L02360 [Tetrapisispora phaffii CBS 4417]
MSNQQKKVYSSSNGFPYSHHPGGSILSRPDGSIILQDLHLIENIAHFDRERIPERVVHAKAAGCKFEFELTDSLSDITYAAPYQTVGYKCPGMIRISVVTGSAGGADTVRDPRGFSFKFYTKWGIHDWVFNNTPIFFIRDGLKFPQFIHTQKKDPQTHLDASEDSTNSWDFFTQNLESIHQLVYLYGPRGIPKSWSEMNSYSGHTFKMINDKGETTYVNFHVKSDVGFPNLSSEEGVQLAGSHPDYNIAKLFNKLKKGEKPTFTCYIQTMTPKQAEEFRYSINDLTKVWPHKQFPLRKFGKITLTGNPENYFQEVEQLAFSPSNTCIPGIEPSNDNVLQTRLFAYPDTQRYRLGANYEQLEANRPRNLNGAAASVCPYASSNFQRDGKATYFNQGNLPNYISGQSNAELEYKALTTEDFCKNKYKGAVTAEDLAKYIAEQEIARNAHETIINNKIPGYYSVSGISPLDLEQPRDLYERIYTEQEKKDMVAAIVGSASNIPNLKLQTTVSQYFGLVNSDLGKAIADGLNIEWVPVDLETYINDVVGRATPK